MDTMTLLLLGVGAWGFLRGTTPTPATADGRGPWPSSPTGEIWLTRPGVALPMVSTGGGA